MYQILLENSRTRDIKPVWSYLIYRNLVFDTVNHKILFDKLRVMGVCQIAFQWFKSYLSDRESNSNLQTKVLNSGLFHVECLKAPYWVHALLFLIYLNDMKSAVSCKLILYADDRSALLLIKYLENIFPNLVVRTLSMERAVDNAHVFHFMK